MKLLQPGDLLAGRYRVVRLIGMGGFGAVYEAEHSELLRKVALKVLLPGVSKDAQLVARFLQEARAAAAIGHPGIVDVLDLHTKDPAFLVMELLHGEELSERISAKKPLPWQWVAGMGAELSDAIAAAHERGIVHRDLKPYNIFLARTRRGEVVKVLDFGIAKLGSRDAVAPLTRTGQVFGTLMYMAPEQMKGTRDVDGRADIYSMGAILFETLTGEPPFVADKIDVLMHLVMTAPPPPIERFRADVPSELAAVVERCLRKRPEDRFATAQELTTALQRVAAARTVAMPAPADAAAVDARTLVDPPRVAPDARDAPEPAPTVQDGAAGALADGDPPPARRRKRKRPKPAGPPPGAETPNAIEAPRPSDPSEAAGAEVRRARRIIGTLLALGAAATVIAGVVALESNGDDLRTEEGDGVTGETGGDGEEQQEEVPPEEEVDPPPRPGDVPPPADVADPPTHAQPTKSGVSYVVLRAGREEEASPGFDDRVLVTYTSWNRRGRMIERAEQRSEQVSRALPGLTVALQLMRPGEQRRLWIPENLAYGDPPERRGPITIDVELIWIEPTALAPRTASGIRYQVLRPGTGTRHPRARDDVEVRYRGWTSDGRLFHDSGDRSEEVQVREPAGWRESVMVMVEGEKTQFWIPPTLFDPALSGTVLYEIELVRIIRL